MRTPDGSPLALRPRDFAAARPLSRELVRISVPGVGERLVMNLALLAYFRVLGGLRHVAVAAYTVGVRMLSFSWIPGTGFGTRPRRWSARRSAPGAATPRPAPAGARRASRSRARSCSAPRARRAAPLARLFTDDAALIAALGPFMLCLALAQPRSQSTSRSAARSAARATPCTPLVAASIGNWVFRVPLAFLFAQRCERRCSWIWLVILGDHVARAVWLAMSFQRGGWATRRHAS